MGIRLLKQRTRCFEQNWGRTRGRTRPRISISVRPMLNANSENMLTTPAVFHLVHAHGHEVRPEGSQPRPLAEAQHARLPRRVEGAEGRLERRVAAVPRRRVAPRGLCHVFRSCVGARRQQT